LQRRPAPTAPQDEWKSAGRAWKHAAPRYRRSFAHLFHHIQHPGGSGWERWRPLVRWTWPAALVDTVVQIMRYESGGREFVWNHGGSGAFGLVQLLPKPAKVWGALSQLVYAYYHKYLSSLRRYGNGWLPWAGCRAFN
jgi:hypothetical protein